MRDTLYANIMSEYARLGKNLDDWLKSQVREVAREWRKLGIADLPSGDITQTWAQFDRKYVQDYIERVSPTNSQGLAAMNSMAGGMGAEDVRNLQTMVIETQRLGSLTGMTAQQINKELRSKLLDYSPAFEFLDKNGRKWNTRSYVSMVNRTATARVARDSYADTVTQAGYDLAQILGGVVEDSHPGCIKWNGRIVSLTGATKGYPTLADAEADGLHHPNCRHYEAVILDDVDGELAAAKRSEERLAA
jgi:hypothetical protein